MHVILGIFKRKSKTKITKKEKNNLLFLLLEDIKQDNNYNIQGRIDKIKELLKDLGVEKEKIDINKEVYSDEYIEEIFYILNVPSKVLNKFTYKKIKKIWDRLE